ncbi:MAG: rhomboid family intramembrane serine protease, partial [Pseudomonadota bacterium]
MFPIRDDNPHYLTPYATYAIIALNVAAWLLVQGLGMEPQLSRAVCAFGLIPVDLLGNVPAGTRLPLGPDLACVVAPGFSGHTLFTSMFMHGGWLHLLGNMWFMWIFGNNVEDSMGHARFVLFYLLCGLVAAVLQIISNPQSGIPMVGASGAIYGVMLAYSLTWPDRTIMLIFPPVAFRAIWLIPLLFFMTLAFGGGNISHIGHLGGVLV